MQIHNIEQSSPEWFEIRKLRFTASNAQAISAQGKGLETLCLNLVAEYLSSAEQKLYTNEDMERGKILEAEAAFVYELTTGNSVAKVGFVSVGEHQGCSPDGLVGDEGLIEIKCKNDKCHLEQIIGGIDDIETAYIWQMQMQMYITGRKWCDFVCYNPNFEKNILIYRIARDEVAIEKIKKGLELGEKRLKEILAKYNEA